MVEKMPTPYDTIGVETLNHLIHAFYRRVGKHPNLAPIFPDDLTETARKQEQFMTQYLRRPPFIYRGARSPNVKSPTHAF